MQGLLVAAVRNQDTVALWLHVSTDNSCWLLSLLHTVYRIVASLIVSSAIASRGVLSIPCLRAVLGIAIGLLRVLLILGLIVAAILLIWLAWLKRLCAGLE